jgi:hypothetical protein
MKLLEVCQFPSHNNDDGKSEILILSHGINVYGNRFRVKINFSYGLDSWNRCPSVHKRLQIRAQNFPATLYSTDEKACIAVMSGSRDHEGDWFCCG